MSQTLILHNYSNPLVACHSLSQLSKSIIEQGNLIGLGLLALQWSDWHLVSKDAVPIVNAVRDRSQNGRNPWKNPIHEIMFIIGREFKLLTRSKDRPASGQHWIHGWSSCWEEFNQCSNSDSSQGLLDNVVILAKVDFPVELKENKNKVR